jgi:hypothetical protein
MSARQELCVSTDFDMSMTQLVMGAALGFLVAQGGLHSLKRLVGWFERGDARERIRRLTPSLGSNFIVGFTKYAAVVGASAAVITLGVWAVRDHLAAKSAPVDAMADVVDAAAAVPVSDLHGAQDEVAALAAASQADRPTAVAADVLDPYADSDFKVQRHPHHAGTAASLKESYLERSEAKARAELLRETHDHVSRSQYDCEAASRAGKYLKAGLDVWGFAAWQTKYFPMDGYKGATLAQCKDIKNVVDPSSLDLQSTVAQTSHR